MFLKSSIAAVALGAALLAAGSANAALMTYTDEGAWAAAAGSPITNTTTDPNGEGASVTSITLGDGTTLHPASDLTVYKVGSGWHTWSGGYTDFVYYSGLVSSLDVNVSPVEALGFEIEPGDTAVIANITLSLNDGAVFQTQSVSGNGGALFFGWVGSGVTSITISSDKFGGFAFGNFFSVPAATPTPEPLTLALFGAGLAGIGALRRRKPAA